MRVHSRHHSKSSPFSLRSPSFRPGIVSLWKPLCPPYSWTLALPLPYCNFEIKCMYALSSLYFIMKWYEFWLIVLERSVLETNVLIWGELIMGHRHIDPTASLCNSWHRPEIHCESLLGCLTFHLLIIAFFAKQKI